MTKRKPISDDEAQQRVFEALAQSISPVPSVDADLTPTLRARLRARIMQAATNAAPAGTTTWQLNDGDWFSPGPFVEMKLLRRDEVAGTQELLVRFSPGVRIPEHSHRKEEQMIVLEGEIHVGAHLLRQGDVHLAAPGSWHKEITTEQGGTVLLRCEYPLPAE